MILWGIWGDKVAVFQAVRHANNPTVHCMCQVTVAGVLADLLLSAYLKSD